ncbi:MAG: class I adenylate cyclase, partial [Spirochaetota bacterium]
MNQDKILSNLESFTAFNSRKTERFYALLPAGHIRRVLSSMLFFIHTNQPRLPGYINEITPHGIHGYEIDDDTRRYLKGVYPTINFNPSNEKPFVQMVAVIGSAGTIAYNKKSDFDFWICVDRSSVSEKKMTLFRSKIEKIQEWAESQSGTEIHLFINDIADLRRNLFDEDEEEAFGSTLGALLKDEFYRSSIILAGKVPFWWVVPVQTDNATYDRLFSEIDPGIRDDSFIDIGNLHHIRKDDFIGAALFQIVKSLGNPFKSILKLGVLEKYLFEDDSVHLISQQLKARVQERKFTNTILDSYLLMFANVYQYYKKSGMEKSSLSILKINLYLKIGPNLSKYSSLDNRKLPYKVEQMYRYVKHWNWNRQFVQELDSFDNWDFPKVTKFWDQVKKFMLLSYQKISREFTHFDLQSKISKSDYTLLSRKIRGYFSTNPDKIEKYISFKETPGEPYLILTEQKDSEGGYFWKLHKKSSETKESSSCVMLKQARHILPLLSWAAINGVYEKSLTRITMNYQEGNIDTETIELLNLMVDIFTGRDLKTKNSYFLREAFAIRNLIVIHYGNRLASSQEYVDYLFHTSWSEDYHKSYDTYDSLLDILPRITQGGVITGQPFDTVCRFYAPDSMQKLLRDYYRVFKRCYDHIVHSESRNKRFITKLNNSYLIVTCKGDSVEASHYTSATNFTSALSVSPVDNVEYAVSPG